MRFDDDPLQSVTRYLLVDAFLVLLLHRVVVRCNVMILLGSAIKA